MIRKFQWRYVLLAILFISCETRSDKVVDPYNFEGRISDSSILYFKNVRQLFYDKEVHEPSKMEQYRFGDRVLAEEKPILNLCIVMNILTDRGYIMVEPNEFVQQQDTVRVHWFDAETNEIGDYTFAKSSMPKHFQFASELYTSLKRNHRLTIEILGKKYPLFDNKEAREAFRVTMYDYYRLIEAI